MKKVANKTIIHTLSYRTIKGRGGKNTIAILAILLTTLLFTALFTVGSSILYVTEESTMRQVGNRAHAGYKYLSAEEYERVKEAGGYTDISYDIIAGFAVNPELAYIPTEVRFAKDKMAEWCFSYPEAGRMPETYEECVVSSKVLDALHIPARLGEKVFLSIMSHDQEGNEKLIEETFTLCGYFQANEASHAQELWISREWLDQNVEALTQNFYESRVAAGNTNAEGSIQASVFFDSSFDIETKVKELSKRAGFAEGEVKEAVNWAYTTAKIDGSTIVILLLMLFIIILSGGLIIYNIFYINVSMDIRYYGLLKTIGVTGRQLRKMVRRQALLLSGIGIPLGLAAGCLVGKGILPAVYKGMQEEIPQKITLNPYIFAGSAVFALLVVYISCIKPCRLAAKVSPIEAVRFVERTQYKKKEKKSDRISMGYLAAANMKRNRKKAAAVIISLSLSLILLNAFYSLIKGFSFDEYVKDYLVSDIQIGHSSLQNPSASYLETEAVAPELIEKLKTIDGVERVDAIWSQHGYLKLSGAVGNQFSDYYESEDFPKKHLLHIEDEIAGAKEAGMCYAANHRISKELLSALTVKEGAFDLERFEQGGYVLIIEDTYSSHWLSVGDKIALGAEEKADTKEEADKKHEKEGGAEGKEKGGRKEKELEVMAMVSAPSAMKMNLVPMISGVFLMGDQDFEELYGTKNAEFACLTVEEGKEKQAEEAVSKLLEDSFPELGMVCKELLSETFEDMMNALTLSGSLLSAVLSLIGILNLMNALITGILSRRQEFAMMQAAGMTGRQLKTMLAMEGVWYGVWSVGIAATAGNGISQLFLYMVSKNMEYFSFRFHVLPLAASIPVIALLSLSLPILCYHIWCRKSIVERLRLTEV